VYKRQRKREATMKHSIAPGIHNVAHRRNLRKREVGSKSEGKVEGWRKRGKRGGGGEGGGRKRQRAKEGRREWRKWAIISSSSGKEKGAHPAGNGRTN